MRKILSLFWMQLLLGGCSYQYPSVGTLYLDRQAAGEVKAEKYEAALERYYRLLEKDPLRAATHSNIGVILNMVQKPEDALKSLRYAQKLAGQNDDKEALFAVHFNLGVYFGKNGRVAEALESYQAALELSPSSVETKTNIELLMQQNQESQQSEQDKKSKNQNQQNPQNQEQEGDGSQQDKQKEQDGDRDNEQKRNESRRENSPKYKPRPFEGDQLSEGDVKKILGELRNQEQKIRANFDKKEKGKSKENEKDW